MESCERLWGRSVFNGTAKRAEQGGMGGRREDAGYRVIQDYVAFIFGRGAGSRGGAD